MRTPKETLERLAEVAPKEFYISGDCYLNVTKPHTCGVFACVSAGASDVGAARFTAFLKEKLREMGLFWTSCCHGDELYDCTVTKDRIVAKSGYVPTEWQAVAEAMIGVLESA